MLGFIAIQRHLVLPVLPFYTQMSLEVMVSVRGRRFNWHHTTDPASYFYIACLVNSPFCADFCPQT